MKFKKKIKQMIQKNESQIWHIKKIKDDEIEKKSNL
jgi:hypothetical protein